MSNSCHVILKGLTDTLAFGRRLADFILPGDIIFLRGDLGAGKTTLTQAIGHGLGVSSDEYITSPTFSLLHEYAGRIPLFHMDLYRLDGEDEILELGFEEYLYGDGVCIIEWPERLGDLTPKDRLDISLVAQDNSRNTTITGYGSMASRISSFQQ